MTINVDQILGWIQRIAGAAMVVLVAVAALQALGVDVPWVNNVAPLNMLYLAGAYALLTGGIKLR